MGNVCTGPDSEVGTPHKLKHIPPATSPRAKSSAGSSTSAVTVTTETVGMRALMEIAAEALGISRLIAYKIIAAVVMLLVSIVGLWVLWRQGGVVVESISAGVRFLFSPQIFLSAMFVVSITAQIALAVYINKAATLTTSEEEAVLRKSESGPVPQTHIDLLNKLAKGSPWVLQKHDKHFGSYLRHLGFDGIGCAAASLLPATKSFDFDGTSSRLTHTHKLADSMSLRHTATVGDLGHFGGVVGEVQIGGHAIMVAWSCDEHDGDSALVLHRHCGSQGEVEKVWHYLQKEGDQVQLIQETIVEGAANKTRDFWRPTGQ